MKKTTAILLMLAVLLMAAGCAAGSTETDHPPVQEPTVPAPENVSDSSEPEITVPDSGIRILGAPTQDVISHFEQTGHTVTDALHGIGVSEEEARAALAGSAYLSPFEAHIGANAEIWLLYGSGQEDFFSTLLLLSEEGTVSAYSAMPGGSFRGNISELLSASGFQELSALSTEPQMEPLLGLAADGAAWDESLFGRLVYEERGFSVQIEVIRQTPDGSAITDFSDASALLFYVESSDRSAS